MRKLLPTRDNPYHGGDIEFTLNDKNYKSCLKFVGYLRKEPLYELRISLREFNWYFRATFFPKHFEGNPILLFCFSVRKDPNSPHDPTDAFMEMTFRVFEEVRMHERDYGDFFII